MTDLFSDPITSASLAKLLQDYGLWVILPAALLEGPVISVLSGWLVALSLIGATEVFLCLFLADLAGDCLLYALGRYGRNIPVSARFGSAVRTGGGARSHLRRRVVKALSAFRARGGRLLILGKLTHSAGFAVLLAAGMVRMPFWRFLLLNSAATLPKTAIFMALGWALGDIATELDGWIFAIAGLVLLVIVFPLVMPRPSRRSTT